MDFRIQETIEVFRQKLGIPYGDFDRVVIAGGAGNFAQLENHLSLSSKLHQARTALLFIHEECGAGAKREDLEKAIAIAREYNFSTQAYYLKKPAPGGEQWVWVEEKI